MALDNNVIVYPGQKVFGICCCFSEVVPAAQVAVEYVGGPGQG